MMGDGNPTMPDAATTHAAPAAIDVRAVRKAYQLAVAPSARIKAALGLTAPNVTEHLALAGVTFSVRRRETVGLLGVNGAGKSTLLQIITGTLSPSSGSVHVDGRISALLELGAGFNPEWTGRRNAEFQCIVSGMSAADAKDKLRAIEEFADVGHFFDQPMRTYSSGMYLRVAFAAAIANDPDILIVDEALAVGDAKFQNKCFARFRSLQERGCTILFVTHSVELIKQFCSRAILLNKGQIVFDGDPVVATDRYYEALYGPKSVSGSDISGEPRKADGAEAAHPVVLGAVEARAHYNPQAKQRLGDGAIEVIDFELRTSDGDPAPVSITSGTRLRLRVTAQAIRRVERPYIGWMLKRVDETLVFGTETRLNGLERPPLERGQCWSVEIDFVASLSGGDYFFDLGAGGFEDSGHVPGDWRVSVGHFAVPWVPRFFGIADLGARVRSLDVPHS
jgi:lipopolysaccharide transport system ATP-binding protein